MARMGVAELAVIVGIILGAALPFLLIALLVWFLVRKKPQGPNVAWWQCPRCGQHIPQLGWFCPMCGQRIA